MHALTVSILSRLWVHLGAQLNLSEMVSIKYTNPDGSTPQPPEGGWQSAEITSLHGQELIRLIKLGEINVSAIVYFFRTVFQFPYHTF